MHNTLKHIVTYICCDITISFYAVIDEEVHVFAGKPITVKQHVKVTIDCSPLIDSAVGTNPVITWYKDGNKLSYDTAPNVAISEDKKQCIISSTLLAVGGQIGTDGNYTCEVCNGTTCARDPTILYVCGELYG